MNLQIEYKSIQDIYWIVIPLMTVLAAYLGYKKKSHILNWLELKTRDSYNRLRSMTFIIGIALIFYALLGPQQEMGSKEVKSIGSDIYILMDTSKSMLAEDVIPSRLERSKKIVEELIGGLDGDRIGFIPYASSAYIQMPLTDDYTMAKMYLDVIDTDMIGGGGTDLAQAIGLAKEAFENTGAENPILLIMGDGEEEDIDLNQVKKFINNGNLKVFTVGVGRSEGALIPIYNEAKSKIVAYKKDNEGNLVMTKLDPITLQSIASSGGGQYYQADNSLSEVDQLLSEFSNLEKEARSLRQVKAYHQLFQWFLGLGLLLLIISLKLPARRFIL